MDDEQILENNIKYQYLNAPCLLEDFKNNYLTSLNIFLNDQKFKEKTDALPVLKSSAITKYEKLISKEQAELLKSKKNKSNKLQPLSLENDKIQKNRILNTAPNFQKKNFSKGIQVRYIIMDHELIEISLQAIEESNEMNNKLTDPFNAYFHESNPKIRKKALEQIINNIVPHKNNKEKNGDNKNNDNNNSKNDSTSNIKSNNTSINNGHNEYNVNNTDNNFFRQTKYKKKDILYRDLEVLQKRYKNYDMEQQRKEEKYAPILKQFTDNCNTHNIITLDQKIDYFVYLYKNNMLKPIKSKDLAVRKTLSKKNNKKYLSAPKFQTPSVKNNASNITNNIRTPISFNNLIENNIRYVNELKNNFKIVDELLNLHQLELFQRDLDNKIKSFQLIKNNFENSEKFIDKLRMYLRCEEVPRKNNFKKL